MDFTPEDIYLDFNRKTYWTRIHAESNSGGKAVILVCASRNYIADHFKLIESVGNKDTEAWLGEVLHDLERNFAGELLDKPVYYKVYAMTSEGIENGLAFLQNEVKP